ncbi:NfeD family protein [Veillonella agrestimuris]|uniref:NfeD family protein n=1 Tax=Veillonella agrestimuris TaxID=2941340 RepID=UPI0020426C75|nr:NfeD family protein [Veillonella agrestimuris]
MDYIFWIIIGALLMAAEIVVPGGIIGLIGYGLFMWGLFTGLGGGDFALYMVLGITAILVILLIVFFNHFSETWIGKLFTLGQRTTTKEGYISNDVQSNLVGKTGIAHTTLRPAGIALIDDNLVDVVTEGGFIDEGTPIMVIRVVGGRNIVRSHSVE